MYSVITKRQPRIVRHRSRYCRRNTTQYVFIKSESVVQRELLELVGQMVKVIRQIYLLRCYLQSKGIGWSSSSAVVAQVDLTKVVMLGKRILRRMESRGWDELEYTIGLNWRRAIVPPTPFKERKGGQRKQVSEMFPGWSGLERERERTHSPSRGVVKFVHGVTVGEVSF